MSTQHPPTLPDTETQRDFFLYAQKRIRQKKWLYYHFVIMLLGILFSFVFNRFFNYAPKVDWYLWLATGWIFIWLLHAFNVFVTHRFMGPEWEKRQMDRLVEKQKMRLKELSEQTGDDSNENHLKTNS